MIDYFILISIIYVFMYRVSADIGGTFTDIVVDDTSK